MILGSPLSSRCVELLYIARRSLVVRASAPGHQGSTLSPERLAPLARPESKLFAESPISTPCSNPDDLPGAGGSLGVNGCLALSPNLPGAASTTATAGGRAAATAGKSRLEPGGAQQERGDSLGSGSSPAGAGVTALRRRCWLALRPDSCPPGRPLALLGARRRRLLF